MRSNLCKLKDSVPPTEKSNVIYQVSCSGCASQYIGKTEQLNTRLKKTAEGRQRAETSFAYIANHVQLSGYAINFGSPKVSHSSNNIEVSIRIILYI